VSFFMSRRVALRFFFAVRAAALGGHLHAEGVDVAKKGQGFLGHADFEAGAADAGGGEHEGAHGIAQEDPIGGQVDGGFEAGGVEVDVVRDDGKIEPGGLGGRFAKVKDGGDGGGGEEFVKVAQGGGVHLLAKAVDGAFGGASDAHDVGGAEEPGQGGAVGGAGGEAAQAQAGKATGDSAAQADAGVAAKAPDGGGVGAGPVPAGLGEGGSDAGLFDTGGVEEADDKELEGDAYARAELC
jgi:hypothetical protein